MFQKAMIEKIIPRRISAQGEKMFSQNLVSDLKIEKSAACNQIHARVREKTDSEHFCDVDIVMSADNQFIMDEQCTCAAFESSFDTCCHIAAVLHAYAASEEHPVNAPVPEEEKESDPYATHFLETMRNLPDSTGEKGHYCLYPVIGGSGDRPHSLNVSFRIGIHDQFTYLIRNISRFAESMFSHETVSYGKKLEFMHTPAAFCRESVPMLEFLMRLGKNEDSFRPAIRSYFSTWYYEESSSLEIKDTLTLKGIYMDQFMDAYRSLCDAGNTMSPCNIIDSEYRPDITLEKNDQGLVLKGKGCDYYEGQNYLYLKEDMTIRRIAKETGIMPVLDCLDACPKDGLFFSEKDLPAFTVDAYPFFEKNCSIESIGYHPDQYRPEKPHFEIYLDMPDRDTISCHVNAVYPSGKYNLLTDTTSSREHRDLGCESRVLNNIRLWFSTSDLSSGEFLIHDNPEKIYRFMNDGIPTLQEFGELFVSARLKRLTVRKAGGIHVNVATNVNLLQLSMFSTDLSSQEITEILNRYTPKQKYYRLKNGTVIKTDSSFDDLYYLKEHLNISSSDLLAGQAEIPFYKALYLNQLSEHVSFELSKDNEFSSLVRKINSIENREYELPSSLTIPLRPYQAEGYRWLCALKDNHFGGLLADEMGLGKTLQVIALMGSTLRKGKCIVICPASLVYNWEAEIHRFMPSLKPRIISGAAEERMNLIESSSDDEILITSYDLLKRDIAFYENQKFDIEVIDEAQYIKNAGTSASKSVKAINSSFRIALTGTPIENRLSELWSIFDFILPGFFSSYSNFRAQFEIPIVRDEDDLAERDLTAMITPFILRRLKKNVLKDLPDKLEQVYYAKLEGEQKELYEARLQDLRDMVESASDAQFRENRLAILAELTRLRQICCEPGLLYENYTGNSAKKELCLDMIREAIDAGHKILLFSQFTTMLDEMIRLFDENGISYHLLTGATPKKKRIELVDSFQHDDVPVFCISLKAGGTGLNLTAADVVIHYDPWWNTAVENQATDRAHRIGQKKVVSVYRLIMKDTIEERILEIQNQKKGLAESILSGEGISSNSITREELLSIL